jgi:hypothetical protein
MTIQQTTDRWEAALACHNALLKDPTAYCNQCGTDLKLSLDKEGKFKPCCENPQVGTHLDHCKGVSNQNRELTKIRMNEFAATKDKSMRWGISIPPRFWKEWNALFYQTYKEDLIRPGKETKDLNDLMRKFKHFRIPDKV